jgi:hypothetical protein
VLIGAIGASDLLQVDGVGGGSTLTSKVAIVSKSTQPDCDVDYLFAQVGVGDKSVDTRPNCGNMLSGVAPFAIEQGLVAAQDGETGNGPDPSSKPSAPALAGWPATRLGRLAGYEAHEATRPRPFEIPMRRTTPRGTRC